jgi:alkanesulfonate monooxygenase SsuD/methylene tetrahydromethanopterin reductase-like flavin-dependent oxidoreductase (luciferase family)
MRLGAHLPLIDFESRGYDLRLLTSYTDAARDLGFDALASNDHITFQRPWLDGIVALSSVVERSGDMLLATTVSLPAVRGPAVLAKAAAAIDILSGGRLVLGVGPGSSVNDYQAVGLPFEERWARLDESVQVLRRHLRGSSAPFDGRFYKTTAELEPRPLQGGGIPIWIGSWGSEAGLRRVARLGDGWLASAYNTSPDQLQAGRKKLDIMLEQAGKPPTGFPTSLATMWTYVTSDPATGDRYLAALAKMLNRTVPSVAPQVLVGPPEECAAKLSSYARAGVDTLFVWPLSDETTQLELLVREVGPLLAEMVAGC